MNRSEPNARYNVASPGSLPARIAKYQRRRMYARFLAESGVEPGETILDVGATSDRSYESSNYVEALYPDKRAITAVGIDDAAFLEALYPGLRFLRGDGLDLPFPARSFDVVHSSAVIEHVGSLANQARFVAECCRVARRAVFITTPNRWFPVEVHTVLPLLHWLPKPAFRAALKAMGQNFFAEEANLNLMTASELRWIAADCGEFDVRVEGMRLAGWTSNLLLIGRRHPAERAGE